MEKLNLSYLPEAKLRASFNSLVQDKASELSELRKENSVADAGKKTRTILKDYTLAESLSVRIGVLVFPGTLDEKDAARAVLKAGARPIFLWHEEQSLHGVDAVVIPGGFSYGDYLRCGAISRFARIMEKVVGAAKGGMPVLGICNGFQILTESHLLPGALMKNESQKFICKEQALVVENSRTPWTNNFQAFERIAVPLKNGEGRFVADRYTLDQLEAQGRVVFRYADGNPNGSASNIAGVCNEKGNVVGLMPHPEHAVEAGFGTDLGAAGSRQGTDGLKFFQSAVASLLTGDLKGAAK